VNFVRLKFASLAILLQDGVSPTLQAKKPGVVIGPIWKKTGLSASDIRRIHKLYKCTGTRSMAVRLSHVALPRL
jgi:hypothetical protein